MKKPWTVCIGNVAEGFELYGPFATSEEASEWAENDCTFHMGEWHLMNINPITKSAPKELRPATYPPKRTRA